MMRIRCSLSVIVMLALFVLAAGGAAGKFYPDDPILREPESRDAANAKPGPPSPLA